MLNVTKPPVHTYLNNNYYFDSTNSNFKLNKLDELDETADEALQLTVPSLQIDRPGIARSAGKLNRPDLEQPPANLPPIVDQLSDSDQLSEVDQLKEISKLSQLSELNKPAKADDQNSNLRSKLGKMFRKFSNLKASKDDKKKKSSSSSSDKPSKLEKKKPLITVIHKTVTKNNVKLFDASQENAENEDANCVSSKLSSDRRSAAPDRPAHKQRRDEPSPNQCSQQSVACQPKSSRSNQSSTQLNSSIQFDDSNLSSLPIDPSPSTNRKIEDVRSRSESKLANCQSRKQAPTKLKSESFYFLESQSKGLTVPSGPLSIGQDARHLNTSAKLLKPHQIKNSRELEEQNFLNKKLIAESLIKSSNREMNALLSTTSTSGSSKPSSTSNLQEANNASHKIPSYIGISCAISGYSTYSKYSSNLGNASEGNSPSNVIRRLNDPNMFNGNLNGNVNNNVNNNLNNNLNGIDSSLLAGHQPKANGQFLDVNRTIESYSSFKNNLNRFNKLSHNVNSLNHPPTNHHLSGHSTHHPSNNLNSLQNFSGSKHLNHSNQFDSFDHSFLSRDRTLLNDSQEEEDSGKSLVQKRIESLYGSNFASNWKESRSKLRIEKGANDLSFRSPSCPPEFITNGLVSSKRNLPVLKYIQSSIFSNAGTKNDGQPSKQTKSEEAISSKSNDSKLSFRSEPQEEAKVANGPNSLISFDEPVSELLASNSPSNDPRTNAVVPNDGDQVEHVTLVREQPFTGDHSNDLESIREDLLMPDCLLGKAEEDVPPVMGIDELDNLKFENEIAAGQPSNESASHEEPSYDGNWYLKKLDEEISKINEKIGRIETISLDEQLNNREEIAGKIRSAIGKGNLLINQKLSQFKELCNKNLNQTPDEQYKTLDKDLEGFYEMISYQIDDVHKTFDEILFLRNNGWIVHNELLHPSPRRAGSKNSSRSNSNANSRSNSKPSSRNTSKEDLRRSKLREVKRKQQQNLQQADDIVIFLPNKSDSKADDL